MRRFSLPTGPARAVAEITTPSGAVEDCLTAASRVNRDMLARLGPRGLGDTLRVLKPPEF